MKHLTFDDRLTIQRELKNGKNFSQIADILGKDRSTIGREVKAHRSYVPHEAGNICVHRKTCDVSQVCENAHTRCRNLHKCRSTCGFCNQHCDKFEPESCNRTERAPFVCNGCTQRCYLAKWKYDAKSAQSGYEESLHESRKGISLADEDLSFLNEKFVPLIKHGISIPIAYDSLSDQMPVSARTLYNYIDSSVLDLTNLDLRLKVRRPLRKKSGPMLKVDKHCYEGRTYEDYLAYMQQNPKAVVCQMDTVEGRKGGKVMLTLYFQNCGLQLMFMRDRNNSASVTDIFNQLRNTLGDDFTKLFQVILTDRGSEFSNPEAIEYNTKTGSKECRVFYCDPMATNQKSECERNHELIRCIFPKGSSLDAFNQDAADLAMNHINSYPRAKWDVKCPIDLFIALYGPLIVQKLGLVKIELPSLILNPSLVKGLKK